MPASRSRFENDARIDNKEIEESVSSRLEIDLRFMRTMIISAKRTIRRAEGGAICLYPSLGKTGLANGSAIVL